MATTYIDVIQDKIIRNSDPSISKFGKCTIESISGRWRIHITYNDAYLKIPGTLVNVHLNRFYTLESNYNEARKFINKYIKKVSGNKTIENNEDVRIKVVYYYGSESQSRYVTKTFILSLPYVIHILLKEVTGKEFVTNGENDFYTKRFNGVI